jgi:hypothetical protein
MARPEFRLRPGFFFALPKIISPGPSLVRRGFIFSPLQGETQRGSGKFIFNISSLNPVFFSHIASPESIYIYILVTIIVNSDNIFNK